MASNLLQNIYFFLISLIPFAIILGPSVSLINIVVIGLVFIFTLLIEKNFYIFKNKILILLFFLYLYLIFNSFIAIDFNISAPRNFGFIRFILLFIAINYFFYKYKNSQNILTFWVIIIFLITFDSYIEIIFGKNIIGNISPYKERVVSFFIDEPIVGGFLLGFLFLTIGYLFSKIL